ncbi:aspartic protease [Aphelenchoides avenae]|nr:aspartic protease [Aphelenchus avenae]
MPIRRHESVREKLQREGRWEAYVRERDLRRSGGVPSTVRDYADNVYDAEIYLGTPPQAFQVIFDTGSGDLWVTDKSCTDEGCKPKAKYDNTTSSTYQYVGPNWSMGYGDGTIAEGYRAKESLTLGDSKASSIVVKGALFGQAVSETADYPESLENFDGILGLSRKSEGGLGETTLATAIKQGLLAEPIFTIWIQHVGVKENATAGQVLYGGIDTEHCDQVIDYVPLANLDGDSWDFYITGFQMGNVKAAGKWHAITDTGTSDMHVPEEIFDAVVEASSATPDKRVDCNAKFEPVVLTINGKEYPVTAEAIINQDSQGCYLALGFGVDLILGDPFIRQYCQIHDLGQSRLGFAKSHPH